MGYESGFYNCTANRLLERLSKSGGKSGGKLATQWAVTTGKPASEAGSPNRNRTGVSAVREE
jgi:hypothetical protein